MISEAERDAIMKEHEENMMNMENKYKSFYLIELYPRIVFIQVCLQIDP